MMIVHHPFHILSPILPLTNLSTVTREKDKNGTSLIKLVEDVTYVRDNWQYFKPRMAGYIKIMSVYGTSSL